MGWCIEALHWMNRFFVFGYLLHHLEDYHFNSTFLFYVSDQIAVISPFSVSLPSLVLHSLTALLLILYRLSVTSVKSCRFLTLFIWASRSPQCLLFRWYICKVQTHSEALNKIDCGLIDHVLMCGLKLKLLFLHCLGDHYYGRQFKNDLHNV